MDDKGFFSWFDSQPDDVPDVPSPLPAKPPAPIPPHPDKPDAPLVSAAELEAGTAAVRKAVDDSGYGSWVKDEYCVSMASEVLVAAAKVR